MGERSAEQQEARLTLELEAKSKDTVTRTRAKYFLAALDALEAAELERDEVRKQAVREAQLVDKLNTTLINVNLDLDMAQAEVKRLRELIG